MDWVFAVNNGVYFNFNNKTNKCHNYIDSQRDEREAMRVLGWHSLCIRVRDSSVKRSNGNLDHLLDLLARRSSIGMLLPAVRQQGTQEHWRRCWRIKPLSSEHLCFLYVSIVVVVVAAIESTCALRYYRPFR